MPVSVVIGGQFGSEGKGKVALEIARRDPTATVAVRVGGPNSGHTAIDKWGRTHCVRQVPAAAVDRNLKVVLPPGSFIDVDILLNEIDSVGLARDQVAISPMARIVTQEHKRWEADSNLGETIGSTQSGTGAAVLASIAREAPSLKIHGVLAEQVDELAPFLEDTSKLLRRNLRNGNRVIIEGTQGFGLSVLHGGYWPKATSRDTSAAGFVAESGLSPIDVDDVTLVIRCHPIRVAGDSGPLVRETTWREIAIEGGFSPDHVELSTVTKRVRRVGKFDAELVRRAIEVNNPTRIVLNHLDYVDWSVRSAGQSEKASRFVDDVQENIGRRIDWVGIGPDRTIEKVALSSRDDSVLVSDTRRRSEP